MKIFQKAYDFIRNWQAPKWIKELIQKLNDLMIAILKEASQAYINYLKEKIIEAAGHKDWSNEKKFAYVYEEAVKGFSKFAITLKDSELNCMIEFLYLQMRNSGLIV